MVFGRHASAMNTHISYIYIYIDVVSCEAWKLRRFNETKLHICAHQDYQLQHIIDRSETHSFQLFHSPWPMLELVPHSLRLAADEFPGESRASAEVGNQSGIDWCILACRRISQDL